MARYRWFEFKKNDSIVRHQVQNLANGIPFFYFLLFSHRLLRLI